MANQNGIIKVGVFKAIDGVPRELHDATLYYTTNPKVDQNKRFRATDVNGKVVCNKKGDKLEFGIKYYVKLVKNDMIVFSTGAREQMDIEVAKYEQANKKDVDRETRRDAADIRVETQQMSVPDPDEVLNVKDPTKHLTSFFVSIMVIAVVIIFVRIFGPQLIGGMQGLLQ